jgi:hypothetical protein
VQNEFTVPPLPSRFHFTPEFQLLVACSSPTQKPTLPEELNTFSSANIDWNAFTTLVDRHHVAALVYAALCRYPSERLPSPVRDRLKKRAIQVRGRALRHAAELIRLNAAFIEQGIDVISLKGAPLSQRLFGDPAMRHVRDMDLMVKPADLDRAEQVLQATGYRHLSPDFRPTRKMKARLLSQDHHFTYCHEGLQLVVELHWGLALWTREHSADLWKHCQHTEWLGTTLLELNNDALLLSLCSHGAGHKWSHLKWLTDVAVLLAQERSSGSNDLIAMAANWDLERALAQAAILVHWLYGTPLEGLLHALIKREKPATALAARALSVLLMDEKAVLASQRFGRLKYLDYTLHLRRRLPFRAHMKNMMIASADFSDLPLPERLFWLYYLLRPWLWLKRRYLGRRHTDPSPN